MSSGIEPPQSSGEVPSAILQVRRDLEEGRLRIGEMHRRGLDGAQVCGRLTSLVDDALGKLFAAAEADLHASDGRYRSRVALVALGGYGRRHQAPFSDVDLMVLHDALPPAELIPIVRKLTTSVFDAGMQLGHSVRTPQEAVQLARGDAVICSSLIDCRLIVGGQPLFEEFRSLFAKMARRRSRALLQALIDARAEERRQYGESLYLLEPHVKRSRGGLRDLHLLRWIGWAEHGESDPDQLHLLGAMSKFDHHRLLGAQAFLLRLRNEMHFHTAAAKDLLSRAEQLRIAELWAYRDGAGLLPVERFMRDYFHHANHLWQMVRRRQALFESESRVGKLFDPVVSRSVGREFRVGIAQVSATRTGLAKLQGNLEEVIRIVELAVLEGKPLDHGTASALLLAAPECDDQLTPAVARRFWQALSLPVASARALRLLHELGYLEKIIPAFKHARCLLQFNQYHKFTVDEHCLRAVEEAGQFVNRGDDLAAAYRQIKSKPLLHLALLLHDLGKGHEEDHSEVGERLAADVATRLELPEEDRRTLKFLVRQHLTMSHLAFRRDTNDPAALAEFARLAGDGQRLRQLFVVTCADLAAVGPGVLTQWKVDVLASLYRRVLPLVETALAAAPLASSQDSPLAQALTPQEADDSWFQRQLATAPESFVETRGVPFVIDALRRLRRLPPRGAAVWGVAQPESGTVEFFAGVDQGHGRGIFSSMAGALSSQGMQILAADTEILADGLLWLSYLAVDADFQGAPSAERLADMARRLEASIDSTEPPKFRRVWGQDDDSKAARLTAQRNSVRVSNDIASQATVVEVFAFDRIGLLYDLARRLHELDLTIRRAKIATSLDQVVDVFYVTDRDGGKVTDPAAGERIRTELLAVIGER